MNASSKELGEVVVQAERNLFEMKIDRLVVNVQSSITASSGTALEVLERSPGLMVDQYNSAIRMNGKNGVQVMINGKLCRMPMEALYHMLRSMPAANIEQIELITTPHANLDAEGEFINFDFDTRSVKLTYTKNFGSQKVKGARKRSTGSAEEQKRL